MLDNDHPRHTEAVGHHAEAWREEGLSKRHLHLPALGQCVEPPVGLGFTGDSQRQRYSLETRLALASAVGRHHSRIADAQAGMHDFVLRTGRDHTGRRGLGAFLETHHHRGLGTECLAVELDCLFAAAVKRQIRLDQHVSSFEKGWSVQCSAGAKRTAAIGGSLASGIVQESPPFSEIHNPPLVEPKARSSPVSSTASACRHTRS